MIEEKIVINKSDLEELIAKEVAKKMTAKSSQSIFADLDIIDERIAEINRSKPEVVEYVKSRKEMPPAYWENLTNLVRERNRYGSGFDMVSPPTYSDPHTLIRKLVLLMFGCRYQKVIDGRDIDKARKLYSEISDLFLITYEEHLNDVINDRNELPNQCEVNQ